MVLLPAEPGNKPSIVPGRSGSRLRLHIVGPHGIRPTGIPLRRAQLQGVPVKAYDPTAANARGLRASVSEGGNGNLLTALCGHTRCS